MSGHEQAAAGSCEQPLAKLFATARLAKQRKRLGFAVLGRQAKDQENTKEAFMNAALSSTKGMTVSAREAE